MRYRRSNRRNPLVPAPKEPTEVLNNEISMDFDPSFNCSSGLGLSFPGPTAAALKLATSTLEPNWTFGASGGFFNFWVYYRVHPGAVNQTIISKRLNATGTNAGWQIVITPTGFVSFISENAGGTTQTVTSATALTANTLNMISVDVSMASGQTRVWIYINAVVSTNILLTGLRYTSTTVNMAIGTLSDGLTEDCRSIVDRIFFKRTPESAGTNITYFYNSGGGRTYAETVSRLTLQAVIGYFSAGDPTLSNFPNYGQTAQRGELVQHPSSLTDVTLQELATLRPEPFRPQIDSTIIAGVFTGGPERYSENIGYCDFRLSQAQKNTGLAYGQPKADLSTNYLNGPIAFTEPHGAFSNRNAFTQKTCLSFDASFSHNLSTSSGEILNVLRNRNQSDVWIVFGPNKFQDSELFCIRDGLGSDRFTVVLNNIETIKILFRQQDSEVVPQTYSVPYYSNEFKYQVLRVRLDYINAKIDAFMDGDYLGEAAMAKPPAASENTPSSAVEFGVGPVGNYYTGDIARILIFNRILDPSAADYVERYIQDNYDTYLGRPVQI